MSEHKVSEHYLLLADALLTMRAPFDLSDREKVVNKYGFESMEDMLLSYGMPDDIAERAGTIAGLEGSDERDFSILFAFDESGEYLGYVSDSGHVVRRRGKQV